MTSEREVAWKELRRLRDFARKNVGKQMVITHNMVAVLEQGVGVFQNDPPCYNCDPGAPGGPDEDIPF